LSRRRNRVCLFPAACSVAPSSSSPKLPFRPYTHSSRASHMCEGFISLDLLSRPCEICLHSPPLIAHLWQFTDFALTFDSRIVHLYIVSHYKLFLYSSNPILTYGLIPELKAAAMCSSHSLSSTCIHTSGMYVVCREARVPCMSYITACQARPQQDHVVS
jgi:hypothetical protein